jgi:hypothetical protein
LAVVGVEVADEERELGDRAVERRRSSSLR